MVAFRLVQVLRHAVDELPVKNEPRADGNPIFDEGAVVDEYAVHEGDDLFYGVAIREAEGVVHFDVFDNAAGAGCEAESGQEEEEECFHSEIK